MNARETAIGLGIKIGKVVKRLEWIVVGKAGRGELIEHTNLITLSAGDDLWDSAARHFAEAAQ